MLNACVFALTEGSSEAMESITERAIQESAQAFLTIQASQYLSNK